MTTCDNNKHIDSTTAWRQSNGRLPAMLRMAGVFAILLSLYSFLMRGWEGSDDLVRYMLLLGHTVLLATMGLGSGHFLKEAKGARVLLIMALVSVVAAFAVLGGFFYAEFGPALTSAFMPAMKWQLNSLPLLIGLTLCSLLLLLPIVVIGFRALARSMYLSLSLIFIGANAALLLPVREPLWIALIALALGAYTVFFSISRGRQRVEIKTDEGLIAIMLQFLPVALLLLRNIWLYDNVAVLFASIFVVAFIAIRQITAMLDRKHSLAGFLDGVSSLLALAAGVSVIQALDIPGINESLQILLPAAVSSAMLYELSARAKTDVYRFFADLIMMLTILSNLLFFGDMASVLITLLASATMLTVSYLKKYKTMLLCGSALLLASVLKITWKMWFVFDVSIWLLCALAGMAAIVLGSVLESKSEHMGRIWQNVKTQYREWSY